MKPRSYERGYQAKARGRRRETVALGAAYSRFNVTMLECEYWMP